MTASLADGSSRAFLLQAGVQPESSLGVHFVGLPLMFLTVVGVAVAPLYWGYMTADNGRDWDCKRFDRTFLEVTRRYVCMLNGTTTLGGKQAAVDWMSNCTSKLKQVTGPLASAEAWAEVEEACRYSPIDGAELSSTFNDSEHCTVHHASADSAPGRLVSVNVERVLVLVLVVVSYAALLWQLSCFVHHWNKFIKSHLADAYCLSDLSPDALYTVKSLFALVLLVFCVFVFAFAIGSFAVRSPGWAFPSSSSLVSTSLIANSLNLLVYAVVCQLKTIGL